MIISIFIPGGFSIGEILADVALGVHDHGPAGGLIAHHVRSVRKAFEVVLVKFHR
jgi:hypothetical protein